MRQFIGTTNYYEHFKGFVYTDGVKYLADRARCYWLVDLVGSYQPELQEFPFQFWEIVVNPLDKSALVTMIEDTGEPLRVRQQIPFTDFPLPRFGFYCVRNVMMLKSEY